MAGTEFDDLVSGVLWDAEVDGVDNARTAERLVDAVLANPVPVLLALGLPVRTMSDGTIVVLSGVIKKKG